MSRVTDQIFQPWGPSDFERKYGGNGDAHPPPAEAPRPTKARRVLSAYQPFPTKLLPHPLARFVREAAAAVGCDESFVALPLLAGLASAIGNSRRVKIKADWSEPPILWTVTVAGSGQRKSPPFDKALAPLREMQAKAMREHRAAMEQYRADVFDYKRKLANAKNDSTAEMPAEPPKPVLKRYIISDTTVEAVAGLLETSPRGLLSARDEQSAWFSSFNQYKSGGRGGDASQWLEMYRAGPLTVDRKNGDRPMIHVPHAAVCVTGTIQPRIFARCAGSEHFESGLIARLLLAMPPPRKRVWTDAEIDAHARDRLKDIYAGLVALNFGADGRPVDVPLGARAQAAFIQFVNRFGQEQAELLDDRLEALWSKLEGTAARLALVFHLVRCVSGDSTVEDPDRIDEASINAGIGLADWFGAEAVRIYASVHMTDGEREEEKLVTLIRGLGGAVTPRDLQKHCRKYPTAEQARKALVALATTGFGTLAHTSPTAKGGRPTEVFTLTEPVDTTPNGTPVDTVDVDNTPFPGPLDGVLSASTLSTGVGDEGFVHTPVDGAFE